MIVILAALVQLKRFWMFSLPLHPSSPVPVSVNCYKTDAYDTEVPVRVHLLVAASALALQPLLASCSNVDTSTSDTSKVDGAEVVSADQSPECLAGDRPYFGDTHLHTSASPDAGMFGNKLDRDVAYEFAQGKKVTSSIGEEVQLRRPHDFIVVADHAESIGLQQAIERSDEGLISDDFGKRLHDLVKEGKGVEAASEFIRGVALGTSKKLPKEFSASEWGANLDSAEANNKPGVFTALVGFEWTSQPGGGNLHRVVILRDGKDRAEQITPFSAYDSEDVEDLWTFMDGYENKTGGRAIAIPHNGNLSSGTMFLPRHQETNQPIDADYARRRQKREPLFEITQIKGHSEAHPLLSPNDEFADFWLLDNSNLGAFKAPTKEMMRYEYVRPGLRRGLELQDQLEGVNPFKFGVIGATDSHTSLVTTDEDAFFGKAFTSEPSKDRWKKFLLQSATDKAFDMYNYQIGSSGLAGVWASENTREGLFDAMERKEVFGTTGTLLSVQMYGGFDFDGSELAAKNWSKAACLKGVPMGGDLSQAPEGKAPTFQIKALRDPDGANLDRIQMVKGWLKADGTTDEKIYNVTWSDPDKRVQADDGSIPSVGNTVDEKEATFKNNIGAASLSGSWTDPDFDPSQRAFYYVRVLEIPTPTWLAFDRKRFDNYAEMPQDLPYSHQERAFSSPVWYNPS